YNNNRKELIMKNNNQKEIKSVCQHEWQIIEEYIDQGLLYQSAKTIHECIKCGVKRETYQDQFGRYTTKIIK
ncbi:MAG TPA: hypothetical protein VF837_05155, partial [Patescibacteria group bacterium]